MKGTIKDIASNLLRSRVRWVESRDEHGMEFVDRSVAGLLSESELEDCLFGAAGFNQEERAAIYGFGNEDIDLDFARIKEEIVRLARTGRCSREVLADAQPVLESLIRGMQQEEWDAKQGINPHEAETNARTYRLLADTLPADGSVTPNDIDHWQGESLLSYQSCKAARLVLTEMLDAVRRLDHAIGSDGPGPAR